MIFATIMAGGTGTRLWPASREKNPKQLHKLISDNSLLQDTVYDLKGIVSEKNVLIVTGKRYEQPIKKQLPQVKHYLFEPYKLGKTLAIGLSALYLAKLDPQAVMILLWSDSFIGNKKEFQKALKQAVSYAENGQNLIIGVKPSNLSTAYGYIEMGKQIDKNLFKLQSFREKPDAKTAKQYIGSKKYVWNPGISVWRVDKLLELYKQFEPKTYQAIMQFEKDIHKKDLVKKLDKAYKKIPKTEIEETIYPRAADLGVIPADIDWNDIGNWSAIYEILATKKDQMIIKGNHLGIDNKNTMIYSENRMIAAIGLDNIAIIDTPDATLICNKDRAQDVKKIVDMLKSDKKMQKYL